MKFTEAVCRACGLNDLMAEGIVGVACDLAGSSENRSQTVGLVVRQAGPCHDFPTHLP